MEIQHSGKIIKNLADFIKKPTFIFPKEAANAFDPQTRKRCFYVSINGESKFIPVQEEVQLEQKWWELLKDINVVDNTLTSSFDPIRNV